MSDNNDLDKNLNDLVSQSLLSNDEMPELVIPQVDPLDMVEVNESAKVKATKVVLSCLELYFDKELITKNQYLQAKSAVANTTISMLFKQLRVAEHMMDKLVNDVDNGNMQTRVFDTATNIQKTIIDLLKNTQMHVISVQEDFRRIKDDMVNQEIIEINDEPKNTESTETNTFLNSRNLLKDLEESEDESDGISDDTEE